MQENNFAFLNMASEYEKLSRLVSELQGKDISFDIRLTLDMERSLLIDKLVKIAKTNNKLSALKQLKEWQSDLELLTFGQLRKTVFNSDFANLHITNPDVSKKLDMALIMSRILGVD